MPDLHLGVELGRALLGALAGAVRELEQVLHRGASWGRRDRLIATTRELRATGHARRSWRVAAQSMRQVAALKSAGSAPSVERWPPAVTRFAFRTAWPLRFQR